MNPEKIDRKIKDLNEIRSIYKRDFGEIEKRYKNGEVSEDYFAKKKSKYDKKFEDIRKKIHNLELKRDTQ